MSYFLKSSVVIIGISSYSEAKELYLCCFTTGGVVAINQVAGAPPLHTLDFEQEREKIRQEYEARISQLTMQYTTEQQNSIQLQEELKNTREAYEQQLADLNDAAMLQVNCCTNVIVT